MITLFIVLSIFCLASIMFINLKVSISKSGNSKELSGSEDLRTDDMEDLKSRSSYFLF